MPPLTSCSPNETLTLFIEPVAHMPSVVARTVIFTASPPRFDLAMKSQTVGSSLYSQPPVATGVGAVSMSCVEHVVVTRTSVLPFEKSISNSVIGTAGGPPGNGVKCTATTSMFGGRRTPSFG